MLNDNTQSGICFSNSLAVKLMIFIVILYSVQKCLPELNFHLYSRICYHVNSRSLKILAYYKLYRLYV